MEQSVFEPDSRSPGKIVCSLLQSQKVQCLVQNNSPLAAVSTGTNTNNNHDFLS